MWRLGLQKPNTPKYIRTNTMANLKEIVLTEEVRPKLIRDCATVLNEEVNKKKGVKGLMIKGGFKVIRKLENGRMIERAIDFLLDEFVEELDAYYQSYLQEDEASRPTFSMYIQQRENEVTESLLSVTDRRRQRASNKVLIATYDKLRGVAAKNVKEGVPAVGRLMQKYAFELNT
ncbi:MAG TPA: hypothetical protein DCE42_27450 [Myxococcales bacterium]|nr:hypothetical protein [Myxococcales bacterium]